MFVRLWRRRGVGLAQNDYVSYEFGDLKALCPLSQLYLAGHPKERDDLDGNTVDNWADRRYGFQYNLGFIQGVDGAAKESINKNRRYNEGFAAGVRVRKSLNANFVSDGSVNLLPW